MRIEEKSDSYRQEGTASIIRFLERSRRLPKRSNNFFRKILENEWTLLLRGT
jgi:hypothetical protein